MRGRSSWILIRLPDQFFRAVLPFTLPQVEAYVAGIAFIGEGPNIRAEYEWVVPDRVALFIMIGHGEVIKTRYEYIHTDGKKWELDEYEGTNSGIVLADIELQDEDEKFELPEWIGQESTKEKRITNNSFTLHPYANWTDKEKSWYASLRKRK